TAAGTATPGPTAAASSSTAASAPTTTATRGDGVSRPGQSDRGGESRDEHGHAEASLQGFHGVSFSSSMNA
ncbi:MAG TPA: hypothetical protein VGF26_13095, partial [Ramlibacter sp.]